MKNRVFESKNVEAEKRRQIREKFEGFTAPRSPSTAADLLTLESRGGTPGNRDGWQWDPARINHTQQI